MLPIFEGSHGIQRRQFMTIDGLGLGGLSLSTLAAARAAAGKARDVRICRQLEIPLP